MKKSGMLIAVLISVLLASCGCAGIIPSPQEPAVENPAPEVITVVTIPAGTAHTVDDYSLTLLSEVKVFGTANDPVFGLSFTVINNAASSKVFRFYKSGMTVRDDLGNTYNFDLSCADDPAAVSEVQNLEIAPGAEKDLYAYSAVHWCFDYSPHVLPALKGPIPLEAKQLIIEINDWGPFDGVFFSLDL